MAWIVTYWQPLAAALATAAIALALHTGAAWLSDIRHQSELITQKVQLRAECTATTQKTKDLADDYQKKSNDLAVRLADALRLPARCILPADVRPTGRSDATAPDKRLSGGNGISTRYLIDFAGRCEAAGQQLDNCQQSVAVIKKQCSQ